MQKALSLNDVAFDSIKGSDDRIHYWHVNKNDAINIMKNSNLNEKSGLPKKNLIIYENGWNNI